MSAATDSAMTDNLVSGFRLVPCCDYHMLRDYLYQNGRAHVGRWSLMIISINQMRIGINH